MGKTKKIAYLAATLLTVAVPLGVSAQWMLPAGTNLPSGSIFMIVSGIMSWILMLFGFIGVIGFAIAGVMYLTAAGDEGQIEKAKKAMSYSIIGAIVGISGYVILQAAQGMLTGFSIF